MVAGLSDEFETRLIKRVSSNQTSAVKDSESLDRSVLSLSARTRDRVFTKIGQNPEIGQNRDKQNPDRQTSDRKSGKNPDSRQKPDGIFRKILTKTRHEQDTDSAVRRRLVQTITKKGKVEKINLGLVQTLFNL